MKVLCPALPCFITFTFNIFVSSDSMYIAMIGKKRKIYRCSKSLNECKKNLKW